MLYYYKGMDFVEALTFLQYAPYAEPEHKHENSPTRVLRLKSSGESFGKNFLEIGSTCDGRIYPIIWDEIISPRWRVVLGRSTLTTYLSHVKLNPHLADTWLIRQAWLSNFDSDSDGTAYWYQQYRCIQFQNGRPTLQSGDQVVLTAEDLTANDWMVLPDTENTPFEFAVENDRSGRSNPVIT